MENSTPPITSPNPVPPVAPAPPPHANKNLFIALIALLLLLLTATGLLAYQNYQLNQKFAAMEKETTALPIPSALPATPDPTTNWQTYMNIKHAYTIKYPSSFELVKGPVPDSELSMLDTVSFSGGQKLNDTNSGMVFSINKSAILCSDNNSCLGQQMKILGKSSDQVKLINMTILQSEVKGFEYITKNPLYSQVNRYFVFPYKGKVWEFNLTVNNYSESELIDAEQVFEQILSTFKFLDTIDNPNPKFCGGIAGIICPEGYECRYEGDYPDAGGTCIKN